MKFMTLTENEFSGFAKKSPYRSFLQTPEIARLREKNGWTSYYFGVEKDKKIVAAALAFAKPTFLGKSTYYIPGGPLLDYEDTNLTNFFFKNLKSYARSHNGYVLHIEPYYELRERDRDGLPKENGFNREKALKNLENLGFKPSSHSDNPQYLFILDLKNHPDEKALFSSFKQNTRNLISRAERKGVKVRELNREELKTFKQITASTSLRRDFPDKPLDYYETMYDLFHDKGEVMFMMAEVSENASPMPLAVAMFITYGSEVIYLFSGSDEEYMKEYNAQYAIQWHMIKYALSHGFKRYNFYGIQGLPDPKSPGYGIYKFKKGFTTKDSGRVVELLGAFDLPLNLPFFHFHALLSKLSSLLRP